MLESAPEQQEIRGYAYSGGGRRIIIVEVTLDGGQSWDLATFQPHERSRPNPYGKFWTWQLWSIKVCAEAQTADWARHVGSGSND